MKARLNISSEMYSGPTTWRLPSWQNRCRALPETGEHTHLGVMAKLKNGKMINLFEPIDREKDFMSPIGYGSLMGILRNYEILNPFVAQTHDAFQRLKRDTKRRYAWLHPWEETA